MKTKGLEHHGLSGRALTQQVQGSGFKLQYYREQNKTKAEQTPVAQACNPSYLGG
jgi:hypothetical protein